MDFKHLINLSLDFHLNEINHDISSSRSQSSIIQLSVQLLSHTHYPPHIVFTILLFFTFNPSSIVFHFPSLPLQISRNYRLLLNSLRSFSFQPQRIRLRSCESSPIEEEWKRNGAVTFK